MKRVFSMILVLMMVVTLGALPVAAIHDSHSIKFVDESGASISGPIPLEATEEQEFTHTFAVLKCGGDGTYGVTFGVDVGSSLPDWLRLDSDTGKITGTPPGRDSRDDDRVSYQRSRQ